LKDIKSEILFETDNIIVFNKNLDFNILLGNVPYYSDKGSNNGILLKFNVGELKPIASRENLDKTLANEEAIQQKMLVAQSEIRDYINNTIQVDGPEKFLQYFKLVKKYPFVQNIASDDLINGTSVKMNYFFEKYFKVYSKYRWYKNVNQPVNKAKDIQKDHLNQSLIYYIDNDITNNDIIAFIKSNTGYSGTYNLIVITPETDTLKKDDYKELIKYLTPISVLNIPAIEKTKKTIKKKEDNEILFYEIKGDRKIRNTMDIDIFNETYKNDIIIFGNNNDSIEYSLRDTLDKYCKILTFSNKYLSKIDIEKPLYHYKDINNIKKMIEEHPKFISDLVFNQINKKEYHRIIEYIYILDSQNKFQNHFIYNCRNNNSSKKAKSFCDYYKIDFVKLPKYKQTKKNYQKILENIFVQQLKNNKLYDIVLNNK